MFKIKKLACIATALTVAAIALFAGCSPDILEDDSTVYYDGYSKTGASCYDKTLDKNIYGEIYAPGDFDRAQKYPLVIMSHGYNASANVFDNYVQSIAPEGVLCYKFDYCGGSNNSRSDGSTLELTMDSMISNLKTVFDFMKSKSYVDNSKIVLLGESQGGLVATHYASMHKSDLAGLALLYPGFMIADRAHSFGTKDDIPETDIFLGMKISRDYYLSMWDLDIYAEMKTYTSDVTIFHGEKDTLVPIKYSEDAADPAKGFPSATLSRYPESSHGFRKADAVNASAELLAYMEDRGLI